MLATSQLIASGVLLLLMLYVAVIDIKFMIIPDPVNAAIFLAGMAASFSLDIVDPLSAITACILGGGFLALIRIAFRTYRGYEGLGRGDVKFVAAASTWTGLEGIAPALLIASVSALVYVGGRQALDRGFDVRRRVPFGPFLALGFASIALVQTVLEAPIAELVDNWVLTTLQN